MPQPGKVSKHGTLNEKDTQDVREVDVDQVLLHYNSASTSHLFGRFGSLPPDEAVAIERRYTLFWSIKDAQTGLDYVALNKANSGAKGRFVVPSLSEGEYKLIVRLSKGQNVLDYATAPLGVILGGVNSLVVSADKREGVFARGMPTEYVDVNMRVGTDSETIMEQRVELDQGNDAMTRIFTIKEAEANNGAKLSLVLNSYSLVKRMKIRADLYRLEPEVLPRVSKAERAFEGRRLVLQALSSSPAAAPKPPRPPRAQLPKQDRGARSAKRTVHINDDVPVSAVLRRFYEQYAPEKVSQVPKIMEHFLTRDKHLGVLFATLEDKYGVRFNEHGEWRS